MILFTGTERMIKDLIITPDHKYSYVVSVSDNKNNHR